MKCRPILCAKVDVRGGVGGFIVVASVSWPRLVQKPLGICLSLVNVDMHLSWSQIYCGAGRERQLAADVHVASSALYILHRIRCRNVCCCNAAIFWLI